MIGRNPPPRNGAAPEADGGGAAGSDPLAGAIVRGVRQPAPDAVQLVLYRPDLGETDWLLSVHPAAPRIARTFRRGRNPPRPGQFCQWLRTRILGGRLEPPRELAPQTLALPIATAEERLLLTLEANGPHSNLLLLDREQRLLIALRHPASPGRRLAAGDAYAPPPRVTWLPADCPLHGWRLGGDPVLARAHDETCAGLERSWLLERLRRGATQVARRQRKRIARRVDGLLEDLARAEDAGRYRRWGDLLKIHAHRIAPGSDSAQLIDEFDPERPEIRIPLDPELPVAANIERLFGRFRKLRDARGHILTRLRAGEAEARRWAEVEAGIVQAADAEALQRLFAGVGARLPDPTPRRGTERAADPPPDAEVLVRVSADGFRVLVGRGNEANDRVTFRLANGRDWWLHAQGVTGAHVIVKSPSGAHPPERTLRQAAWLAAYYSRRRADRLVDVDLTQRKHVRKIKGGAPGQVTYSQNRTLLANLDDAEAAAILDSTLREKGD